jgi:hypothetical protein
LPGIRGKRTRRAACAGAAAVTGWLVIGSGGAQVLSSGCSLAFWTAVALAASRGT